jgi:[lysine-biosynthesis-protein LysW]--L-2-aminoadipate ligase
VGVLCSRIRLEEKLIFQALRERGVGFERIDVRQVTLDLNGATPRDYDVVLIRCLSHSRALYAVKVLQEQGVRTVNSYETIATCGDKVLTTLALIEHGVPTPRTAIAFAQESALAAAEEMGYPVVLKPPVGSWGRLMAKLNDRDAAEAVIEHEKALHRSQEVPFYIQDYVHKPGRDIRTLVVGDETVYAVYRNSPHWITNTARGGNTSNLPVAPEIDHLSRAAAEAVGGGIVAVDILEDPDGSLLVNEVNHTPEFHGAMQATDADIAGRMVDYILKIASEGATHFGSASHLDRRGK